MDYHGIRYSNIIKYLYLYLYIYYIFITSSWSSFSPMIDSFHLRNSSRSIHRQRRALATVARRWDIGSAGPTWPSPAFPASCNTIKIHWRRQKNRQRHTKFRDVFFFFLNHCVTCVTLSVLYLLLRMDFFFEKSPRNIDLKSWSAFCSPLAIATYAAKPERPMAMDKPSCRRVKSLPSETAHPTSSKS